MVDSIVVAEWTRSVAMSDVSLRKRKIPSETAMQMDRNMRNVEKSVQRRIVSRLEPCVRPREILFRGGLQCSLPRLIAAAARNRIRRRLLPQRCSWWTDV